MRFEPCRIPDVVKVTPPKFGDDRGFFSETYRARALAEAGIDATFVQDNQSLSTKAGVVRGLHFQSPPHAQGKLIRVLRGAILDVAVDLRVGSATFGQHVAVELSSGNWSQLWVPEGFAHGFCALTAETEVFYKVTDYYAPQTEGGILWSDPDLAIDWPVGEAEATLSEKDRILPRLKDLASPFVSPAEGT